MQKGYSEGVNNTKDTWKIFMETYYFVRFLENTQHNTHTHRVHFEG